VLAQHDRQQDRRRLQRRHGERKQRGRDHAHAREATLAEAERDDGGNREQIEQRIGDHSEDLGRGEREKAPLLFGSKRSGGAPATTFPPTPPLPPPTPSQPPTPPPI